MRMRALTALAAVCVSCKSERPAPITPTAATASVAPPAAASASAPSAPEEPPAPSGHVDANLPLPEYQWWVGDDGARALLLVGSWKAQEEYFAVVDIAKGCIAETHADFDEVYGTFGGAQLNDGGGQGKKDAEQTTLARIQTPEVTANLEKFRALYNRFGVRAHARVAWSADGQRMLLNAGDWMYRSRDGGHTWKRLESAAAYKPRVSSDGKWGIYHRWTAPVIGGAYRVAVVAMDKDTAPVLYGTPVVRDVVFSKDEQSVIFSRGDEPPNRVCVDRLELATGKISNIACWKSNVISSDIMHVSRSRGFGVVEVLAPNNGPTKMEPLLKIVAFDPPREVASIKGHAIVPPIDDNGRIAFPIGVYPNYVVHVASSSGEKEVAKQADALGWDKRGRLVVRDLANSPMSPFDQDKKTLGGRACGLYRAVTVDGP
jgi:hypothetical protein